MFDLTGSARALTPRPWRAAGVFLIALLFGCRAESKPIRTFGDGKTLARAVAFTPDGQFLAAGLSDGSVRAWELSTGKQIAREEHFDGRPLIPGQRLAISSFGTVAYACPGGSVRLFNPFDSSIPTEVHDHVRPIESLAFGRDGRHLVSVSGGMQYDARGTVIGSAPVQIVVRDLEQRAVVSQLDKLRFGALSCRLSDDGSLCAMLCAVIDGEPATMPFAPEGPRPAARIVVVEVATGRIVWQVDDADEASVVMDFSPDARLLLSGDGVWEIATGRRVRRLPHGGWFCFVSPSTLLRIRSGGGGTDIVTAPRWIDATYLDVRKGRQWTAHRERQPPPLAAGRSAISPALDFYVDTYLRLWRLPK